MVHVGGDEAVAELARVVAGEPAAVRRLLDESGPVVYGYALARVGSRAAADDVVQDTFLEAIRSAHTFRGDSLLTTWLCAIARRRVARHFAAERRTLIEGEGDDERVLDVVAEDEVEDVDERDEVVRALGRLPVLHRQVLVRKYLDDCPVAEIAAELGRTTVQVQSLLQRARAGLRRQLEVIA
jgi:RNA polymerase sigma-70 factor (ECF subfamily)